MKRKFSSIAFKKFILGLYGIFISVLCLAQEPEKIEMADTMRSNGKIYIVVAVCVTILIGLFLYIANVDRRLRRWEKEEVGK